MSGRRVRSAGDGGVTLVEAAFVLPVVLLVFFSIMEFGLFFAANATTSSSTRAGARYASANFAPAGVKLDAANKIADEVESALSALTSLDTPLTLRVFQAGANGLPTDGSYTTCATDCFRFTWNTATKVFDYQGGAWGDPQAGCTNNFVDDVGVYVTVRHTMVSGFFGSQRTVAEKSITRLEPLPLSQC